jgi:hypothetical protein
MRISIAAALVFVLLPGLAAFGSTAGLSPTATCNSIIVPGGPISWHPRRVVLGVAAVPPAYIPQTVSGGVGRWRYWSKSGLVVRADSPPVFVIVPRRWRDRAAIGWGDAGPVSAMRIASCPPSSSLGAWNPYSGGFYLRSRSDCIPLTCRVESRSATLRFGVGKRCG